jgi:hypothetical protein
MAPESSGNARPRHAHLLTRRARVEPDAPAQPVSARAEPAAPPGALVELVQHRQQLVGGGRDLRRQLGDALAELLELHAPTPRREIVIRLVHRFVDGHLLSSCQRL